MPKKITRGGYPTWRCRRCGVLYTAPGLSGEGKYRAIELPNDNCTSDVILHADGGSAYMELYQPHYCKDQGIGIADFIGLSPNKIV